MDYETDDNKQTAPVPEKGKGEDVSVAPDFSKEIVGAYNPGITQQNWEKGHAAWNESAGGRLAIRLFSRGVMGAVFFTAGGLLNRKWMHDMEEGGSKYDATKKFSEQENPLQVVAKAIDTFVGKPIEFTVRTITGSEALAKRAVRFRPTKFKDAEAALYGAAQKAGTALPRVYRGRSLGNETVAVTFDFFCASIGDAWGRDIAGFIDPNVKHKWIKDGRVDVPEAVKTLGKTMWRYVSYNGGEDWAVAIPYVYFMKGQRSVINHFSPGFAYDFDRNLNGGSFKIDKQGQVIGNYNVEGAVDLQTRFTVYNMGTLLYRELYDYVSRKLRGKNAALYGAPDQDLSKKTMGEKTADVFKWMARAAIKGGIYMTPATPFFWMTRTPQTKHRGVFVHVDEHGRAMTLNYENQIQKKVVDGWHDARTTGQQAGPEPYRKYENVYANELPHEANPHNAKTGMNPGTEVYFSMYEPKPHSDPGDQFRWVNEKWFDGGKMNPIVRQHPFDPYGKTFGPVDATFNAFGKANYRAAHLLDPVAARMDTWVDKSPLAGGLVRRALSLRSGESFKRFTHPLVYASASYTPYMYAKAEFARLWDDGKMDMATERMIDGATSFNWGEFKAGTGEVWRAILHKPLVEPGREAEAQRRIKLDTSDSDAINRGRREQRSWSERVVQGRPEDRPEIDADKPTTYAEQEKMREALKEMVPPTNSIN